jgi:hypothetical protein
MRDSDPSDDTPWWTATGVGEFQLDDRDPVVSGQARPRAAKATRADRRCRLPDERR